MRLVKAHQFNEVHAWEVGWSIWGYPRMTVFFYYVDGILIDTGIRHCASAIQQILKDYNVQVVLLTHHHEDHSGNASLLQRQLQVDVLGHSATVEIMKAFYRIKLYRHVTWGRATNLIMREVDETIDGHRFSFRSIPTPGHCRDHLVYWSKELGCVWTGDLFLAERIRYFHRQENIYQQIESIQKVLNLDFDLLLCGHRPHLKNGKKYLSKKLQFLKDFVGQVQKWNQQGYGIDALMKKIKQPEIHFVKYITYGEVSAKNMVRSVLKE